MELAFRNQFVVTNSDTFDSRLLKHHALGSCHLWAHPQVTFAYEKTPYSECWLIGNCIHPDQPEHTEADILLSLARAAEKGIEGLVRELHLLTGRFTLICRHNMLGFLVFNDACGTQTTYVYARDEEWAIGSSPPVIGLGFTLEENQEYAKAFKSSSLYKSVAEFYLPAGETLYRNLWQVIPNHYFTIKERSNIRFFPFPKATEKDKLLHGSSREKITEVARIMRASLDALSRRGKVRLALSAGSDSRLVLASCKGVLDRLECFTIQPSKMSDRHPDITIPQRLSREFGFKHHVIPLKEEIDPDFERMYRTNVDYPHTVFMQAAEGIHRAFPESFFSIGGSCAEIGKAFYSSINRYKKSPYTLSEIINLVPEWSSVPYIETVLKEYLDDLNSVDISYSKLDLFYWEQRMGTWLAHLYLERDIAQKSFSPYCNRRIQEIMLSIPEKERMRKGRNSYLELIKIQWPELLKVPINPHYNTIKLKAIRFVRRVLIGLGVFGLLKALIKR